MPLPGPADNLKPIPSHWPGPGRLQLYRAPLSRPLRTTQRARGHGEWLATPCGSAEAALGPDTVHPSRLGAAPSRGPGGRVTQGAAAAARRFISPSRAAHEPPARHGRQTGSPAPTDSKSRRRLGRTGTGTASATARPGVALRRRGPCRAEAVQRTGTPEGRPVPAESRASN
jgi:hypothetical protein